MVIALSPLYGVLLGAAGAWLLLFGFRFAPAWVAAAFVVLLWETAETLLEKNRKNSSVLIAARVVTALAWFEAFQHLDSTLVLPTAIAAHAVSRAAVIALAWISRPAAGGLQLCARLTAPIAATAMLIGVAATLFLPRYTSLAIVVIVGVSLRWMRSWYYHRRGGIDAEAAAVTQKLTELLVLFLASFL